MRTTSTAHPRAALIVARRFTTGDGMLLVAATALTVFLSREYIISLTVMPGSYYKHPSAERLLEVTYGAATCAAAAGMLALIPVRLRYPRPPLRKLARQPGFAACCALASLLTVTAVGALLRAYFRSDLRPFCRQWESVMHTGSYTVGGAWLFLAASGRWRSEAGWIDRLGRCLGAVWVTHLLKRLVDLWLPLYLPAF